MVDMLKQTFYKAGGLLLDRPDLRLAADSVYVDPGVQAPAFIDNRGILMPADDQGQTSECAAFAMSSVIEVALWKKKRKQVVVDPHPIYAKAKLIDGNAYPGTYLDSVFKAAKMLQVISPDATMRALRTRNDVKFAIREQEICLLGFKVTAGWNTVDKRTGFIGPETEVLGGHAVAGCWYKDAQSSDDGLGVGNSWGLKWAINGFGRMTWKQFDEQFMYGLVIENL